MCINKVRLIVSSIFLLIIPQYVIAQCDAKIGEIRHLYDDFESYYSSQKSPARKEIRVSIINDNDCNAYMLLSTENQSQLKGQFQSIDYQIRSDSQKLILPLNTRFTFIDSATNINLFIPVGTIVRAGKYTDRFVLKLFGDNNALLDEKYVEIQEDMPARASLSILGYNARSSNVYLGELIPNKEYNMLPTFKVTTNTDVKLHIFSDNKGELRHRIYKTKYAIGYFLSLDGEIVNLKQDYNRVFSYNGRNDFLMDLKVRLDDFRNQAAGEYTDVLRFQISPLNY
ncbi:hypothetical protein [Marinomonas sp.]|uniref:hypothetical protein n=1 Tax=Marinomonas sp. TaxID=1904862 RepID=UPI003BA8438B